MSALETITSFVGAAAEWTRLGLESLGAATIAAGAIVAIVGALNELRQGKHVRFTAMRFVLARYLSLALEFQLAADVLETAIAPQWTKIGQLAAIATIRTALNYFLSKEIQEERRELAPPASP